MPTRGCPACGATVKLENLERHVANVHPGTSVVLDLTPKDRQSLRPRRGRGTPVRWRRTALVGAFVVVLVAALAWGLPNPGGHSEDTQYHIHPSVRITIGGQPVVIPANIGIDPAKWSDHSLDEYSMMTSMSPLHTHDTLGTIHVESRVTRDYTIGEFFQVWGKSFDSQQVLGHAATGGHEVWMIVDGSEMPPSTSLVFRDQMQIEIVCDAR